MAVFITYIFINMHLSYFLTITFIELLWWWFWYEARIFKLCLWCVQVQTDISVDTKQQTLQGVAFPIDSEAAEALKQFRQKKVNYVQLVSFSDQIVNVDFACPSHVHEAVLGSCPVRERCCSRAFFVNRYNGFLILTYQKAFVSFFLIKIQSRRFMVQD